jgi:hypothetical protein
MHALPEIEAAVRALGPADFVAFRKWFMRFSMDWDGAWRYEHVVRTAADYEAFDPGQHDLEREVEEGWSHDHWLDDLRNLQSEADAEKTEVRRAAKAAEGPSPFTVARELFKAANPEPPYDAPPEVRAEWDWRELEHLYVYTGQEDALKRHRLERGAYLARKTEMHRDAKTWVDAWLGPLKTLPPRDYENLEPWPPDDGSVAGRWRRDDEEDEDREEENARRAAVPAYARADDLWWGAQAWWMSLPEEAHEVVHPTYKAVQDFASASESASHGDIRPGNIGRRLLAMRRAHPKAQEALEMLDLVRGYPWMTRPAYDRLVGLVEEAREALMDHYLDVKRIYEGLRACALRVLGGTLDDE